MCRSRKCRNRRAYLRSLCNRAGHIRAGAGGISVALSPCSFPFTRCCGSRWMLRLRLRGAYRYDMCVCRARRAHWCVSTSARHISARSSSASRRLRRRRPRSRRRRASRPPPPLPPLPPAPAPRMLRTRALAAAPAPAPALLKPRPQTRTRPPTAAARTRIPNPLAVSTVFTVH